MAEAAELARKRLSALEERVPWTAVKKLWATRRNEWVAAVGGTLDAALLARQLIVLESMLKTDALTTAWTVQKQGWRDRVSVCRTPAALEAVVSELETAIQWPRILVAPDGRPLSAAEIASGQFGVGGAPSVPLPPPLSVAMPSEPPEGVPRSASRMLVLLEMMGAKQFDPKVVVQLLDYAHNWAATILSDASANARMRVLGRAPNHQLGMQWATQTEPPVEPQDVVLAVRGRTEHGFTQRAAREVIAQQAADVNAEPMPILPRRVGVLLPSEPAAIDPAGRRLMARGLDLDDDEELGGRGFDSAPSHSWWALRTKSIHPPPEEATDGLTENTPAKRQRPL